MIDENGGNLKQGPSAVWQDDAFVRDYTEKSRDMQMHWYETLINEPSIMRMIPTDAESILDFGAGSGVFAERLAKHYKHVIATDMQPAIRYLHADNVEIFEWDGLTNINEIQQVDVIIAKLVFPFIDNIADVLQHLHKILKPCGSIIVSIQHPKTTAEKYALSIPDSGELAYDEQIGNTGLAIHPILRTQKRYEELFAIAGFKLAETDEPMIPDNIADEHNVSVAKRSKPSRLNMRFVKNNNE